MAECDVVSLVCSDLDLALNEPFGISTGAQTSLRNLLVRVTLASGATGIGEAAPFEAVNGETREGARAAIERVAGSLIGRDARSWRALGPWLGELVADAASARCAIETAMLDAMARHYGVPLWVLFGGASTVLETDMTITTGTPEAARVAAARIAGEGYRIIKLKVGGRALDDDSERIRAVVESAPQCGLLLDANAAMESVDDALWLLDQALLVGGRVVLFEQPMGTRDLAAMAEITARAGVPIAADESAASLDDVLAIAHAKAAHVVNLKVMKSGVAQAFEMALAARAHGLGLMIGGMVESDVAMSLSAHLAAGLGGFGFVDLDTPLWLVDSPTRPGYTRRGPTLDVSSARAGHGADL